MNKSHLTAIRRKGASTPLKVLATKHLINASQTVLDFGCGHGADVAWLKNNGYAANGWDIYWNNDKNILAQKYDVVLCTYVLNVVGPKMQDIILRQLKYQTKKGGTVYVTVRRDFKKNYITKKGTQQYLVTLPYKKIKENSQYCIYEIKVENND